MPLKNREEASCKAEKLGAEGGGCALLMVPGYRLLCPWRWRSGRLSQNPLVWEKLTHKIYRCCIPLDGDLADHSSLKVGINRGAGGGTANAPEQCTIPLCEETTEARARGVPTTTYLPPWPSGGSQCSPLSPIQQPTNRRLDTPVAISMARELSPGALRLLAGMWRSYCTISDERAPPLQQRVHGAHEASAPGCKLGYAGDP